jgi:hypothetical protein
VLLFLLLLRMEEDEAEVRCGLTWLYLGCEGRYGTDGGLVLPVSRRMLAALLA